MDTCDLTTADLLDAIREAESQRHGIGATGLTFPELQAVAGIGEKRLRRWIRQAAADGTIKVVTVARVSVDRRDILVTGYAVRDP